MLMSVLSLLPRQEYNHSLLVMLFLKPCKFQLSWKLIPDLYLQTPLLFHPTHVLTA